MQMSQGRISSYTYQSLLNWLSLSHWQFMILILILFFLSSIVYFLYKLGLLTRITFSYSTLLPSTLVYISYQGSYDSIQHVFQLVMNDMNKVFKCSDYFGIYYDNPKQQKNQQMSTVVLGLVVNKIQIDKVKLFIDGFRHYRVTSITQQTKCLGTLYPFFNAMSLLMVIMRVYPRLAQEVKRLKIQSTVGIMQIYKTNHKSPHIQVFIPLQNLQNFQLWYQPTHKFRIDSKNQQKQNKQQ